MSLGAVVAFAFGTPSTIRANQQIADIASEFARAGNLPIFTQRYVHTQIGVPVEYFDAEPTEAPTLRIARAAVAWAIAHRIRFFWVVAALPHLPRCLRDLKYAIAEVNAAIAIYSVREVHEIAHADWFCADSAQLRTRSPFVWCIRERIQLVLPMCLYERIAS